MANTSDANAVNGNAVYGLKALGLSITSTLLNSCVVLAALGLMADNKADAMKDVGTPSAGILLSGAEVAPIRKKEIVEVSEFDPLIESIDERDIKTMGYRDTSATIATGSGAAYTVTVTNGSIASVAVTNGGSGYAGCAPTIIPVDASYTGQGAILEATISGGSVTAVTVVTGGYSYGATVNIVENTNKSSGEKDSRPVFKWSHKETPGYVYKRDIDRQRALAQGNTDVFNSGVNDLTTSEQKRMVSALIQYANRDAIYGTPTTQTDSLWDHQFGLDYAIAPDNTYAGIDRTVTANYWWRSIADTTARNFTLEQLWADSHLTKGVGYLGGNIDVYLVGPALFAKFQKESGSYQINANTDDRMMQLRQFGFTNQCIKYNTSYVMTDNRIKPNVVYGLNTKSWIFATKSGYSFKMSEFKDQSLNEGGKQAFYGLCDLQWMLACIAPALNVRYTNVS